MHQAIRQHLIITYAISLGLITVFVSLLQPIPSASAQQPTRPVSQEIGETGTQGRRIENMADHPSIPNEVLGKEGQANLDSQAAPTDSKATEPPHRIRRTFSTQLLTNQLRTTPPTVATKREHDFSIQGAVIA